MKARLTLTDGEQQTVEAADLFGIASEIEEIVAGCDFAVKPQHLVLLEDDGSEGDELQGRWSLVLERIK